MSKTLSPPLSPARVSVPVTPEVHEAFKKLAAASNMSTGRAIAEWLSDTVEAAQFMAQKIEQARAAPKLVMQEMHAYALGMVDETSALLDKVRQEGKKARNGGAGAVGGMPQAHASGRGAPIPPSCNTGGKVPKVGKIGQQGKKP